MKIDYNPQKGANSSLGRGLTGILGLALAASAVVPLPAKQSNIQSFSFVNIFIKWDKTLFGFWVGCAVLSLPMQIGVSIKLCISFCFEKLKV